MLYIPGFQRRLVVVSICQLGIVSDLYRHRRAVTVEKPFHQRPRVYLRRRCPASRRYQLFRRRHYRAAKYSQHDSPTHHSLSQEVIVSARAWKKNRRRALPFIEERRGVVGVKQSLCLFHLFRPTKEMFTRTLFDHNSETQLYLEPFDAYVFK